MKSAGRRRDSWILVAIVIVAALIRLPSLLHDGLFRDEAYVYVDVIAPTFREFLRRVTETEWHPPFFFVITWLWVKLAGMTELSFKFLPFVFSVLTVPAVYRLGRLASSTSTGLLAAAMYAVGPAATTYSTDYLYPLMGLLCTILAFLVVSARREMKPARFAAVALVTLLVVYTHYFSLIYVPLLMLWALSSRGGIKHAASLWAALALGSLPFIFWIPVFLHQRQVGLPQVPPAPAAEKAWFFLSSVLQLMPVRPMILALVFLLFVIAALAILARKCDLNADAVALGLIFAGILAFAAADNLRILHYIVPFYGLLCVSLAWAITSCIRHVSSEDPVGWRRWGVGIAALFGAAFLIGDFTYAAGLNAPLSGIRSFVATRPLDPETLYVIAPNYMAATFAFYARNSGVRYSGFVQTDHPEIYRLQDEASAWGKPTVISDEIQMIARESDRYRYLDFVVDDDATNMASIPFGKVWLLLHRLEARYPLLARSRYGGRDEPISVYRFLLRTRSRPSAATGWGAASRLARNQV